MNAINRLQMLMLITFIVTSICKFYTVKFVVPSYYYCSFGGKLFFIFLIVLDNFLLCHMGVCSSQKAHNIYVLLIFEFYFRRRRSLSCKFKVKIQGYDFRRRNLLMKYNPICINRGLCSLER